MAFLIIGLISAVILWLIGSVMDRAEQAQREREHEEWRKRMGL